MKRYFPLSLLGAFALIGALPAFAVMPEPPTCTMDAKMCPDGKTYVGREGPYCEFAECPSTSCAPYMCADGTEVARCAADGTVINYFAAPCLTHGGEVGTSPFSDVSVDHPNAAAILHVKAAGIVSGYPDGTYRPDQTINRAEFVKIVTLYKFGQEMIDMCGRGSLLYTDIDEDAWYQPYLCRARDAHLANGYPDGSFRPANSINFVEAAKILAYANSNSEGELQNSVPSVPGEPWYAATVRYLASQNVIPTTITRLDQNITRGEMAEMIYRLQTGITDKPSQTYEGLHSVSDGWIRRSHANQSFSLALPAEWKGIFASDRSFYTIGEELKYSESEYGDPRYENSIWLGAYTDESGFWGGKTWGDFLAVLGISLDTYSTVSTQQHGSSTSYVFDLKPGKTADITRFYLFEKGDHFIVIGVSENNAIIQQIVDSFRFSS